MSDLAIVNAIRDALAGTTVTLNPSELEIGKIVLKDDSTSATAKVADGTTIVAADNALAVHDHVLGQAADAAVSTDTTASISARVRALVLAFYARIPALGQALMAASMPVTIASNQSAVSVTGTQLPSTIGQKAMAASMAVVVASDQSAVPVSATQLPAALGQGTMATSMKVAIASDQSTLGVTPAATEAHLGAIGGALVPIVATFTRPGDATPYTANDAVNNSTSAPATMQFATAGRITAGNGGAGTGYITGVEITHEVISVTPRLRLYLFNTSPTLNNDNAAYAPTYAITSAAGFLGVIDLPAMTSLGLTDASRAQDMTIRVPYKCAASSQIIYALIQTLDAFTPGNAKSFAVKLWFDQN